MSWYAVRCIFKIESEQKEGENTYEERITLWQADSFDGAIAKAENEAAAYGETISAKYLEIAQAHQLMDPPAEGAELFSLTRSSNLAPADYVDRFYNSGGERDTDNAERDPQLEQLLDLVRADDDDPGWPAHR